MQGYLSRIHFHFRFRCSSVSRPLTWSTPQLLTLAKIATFWCLARNANSNSGVWSSQVGPAKLPLCHRLTDAACVLYPVSLYPGFMPPCNRVCVCLCACVWVFAVPPPLGAWWGTGTCQSQLHIMSSSVIFIFSARVCLASYRQRLLFFFGRLLPLDVTVLFDVNVDTLMRHSHIHLR